MDDIAAYTPLECLLIFRSLAAIGVDDEDFDSISKQLNRSPLLRNCPSYDPKRLEASALRQLYFELLQDSSRAEDEDSQDQRSLPLPRKRKIISSNTSSIKDCSQFKFKLPSLVEKLYARYRDYMIKAIADDERRIIKLQGQIKKLEKGEWKGNTSDEDRPIEINGKKLLMKKRNVVHLDSSHISRLPSAEGSSLTPSLINSRKKSDRQITGSSGSPSPSSRNENSRTNSKANLSLKKAGKIKLSQPNLNSQTLEENDSRSVNFSAGKDKPCQQSPSKIKFGKLVPHVHSEKHRNRFSTSPEISKTPVLSPTKKNSKRVLLPVSSAKNQTGLLIDTLTDAANKQRRISSPLSSAGLPKIPSKTASPLTNSQLRSSRTKLQDKEPSQHRPSSQPLLLNQKHRQLSHSQPLQSKSRKSSFSKSTGQALVPLTPSSQSSNKNKVSHLSTTSGSSSPKPLSSVTGYGTNWNPTPTGSTPRNFTPLPPPEMEPLSPILKPSKITPVRKLSNIIKKIQERPKALVTSKKASSKAPLRLSESSVVDVPPERQIVLSKVANERSCDQADIDSIKKEVSSLNELERIDTTRTDQPSNLKLSRTIIFPRRTTKRKREKSSDFHNRAPSTVLWTRAFPRISAQALQDISTDKNASMFANPIKEKDAPGYRKIILRPQDLKSIRSAITAGHRAALAAAPDDLSPSTTSLWLPITEDLIPPKGIINYAQLEKELMRMFANAIMFNADPRRGFGPSWQDVSERNKEEAFGYSFDEDSVVKGTRDMYAAVEKKVSDLRSVERRNEKSWNVKAVKDQTHEEAEDSATCQENQSVTGESLVKRRRKF